MSMIDQTKSKMQAALEHFKAELKNLRTGRANTGIFDSVMVEVYGAQMRLRDLANVTAPESRQLLITPFDPQTTGPIAKGIERANLNLQPIIDGHVIRINIPPMDEQTRKEIVKVGKKKSEDAKIAIRDIRRKANEAIRKQKESGEVTEDVMKKSEKAIQDFTDQFCRDVDALLAAKEKEIMTV